MVRLTTSEARAVRDSIAPGSVMSRGCKRSCDCAGPFSASISWSRPQLSFCSVRDWDGTYSRVLTQASSSFVSEHLLARASKRRNVWRSDSLTKSSAQRGRKTLRQPWVTLAPSPQAIPSTRSSYGPAGRMKRLSWSL